MDVATSACWRAWGDRRAARIRSLERDGCAHGPDDGAPPPSGQNSAERQFGWLGMGCNRRTRLVADPVTLFLRAFCHASYVFRTHPLPVGPVSVFCGGDPGGLLVMTRHQRVAWVLDEVLCDSTCVHFHGSFIFDNRPDKPGDDYMRRFSTLLFRTAVVRAIVVGMRD